MRRMAEDKLLRIFCLNGVDFDAEKAWTVLVERGIEWLHGDKTFGHASTKAKDDETSLWYRKLVDLPCGQSPRVFKAFTSGGFARMGKFGHFKVGLQDFSRVDLDRESDSHIARLENLRTAIDNFEAFLIFFAGTSKSGVTKSVRDNLFGGGMSSEFWKPRYLRYLCEETIAKVTHSVLTARKDDYMAEYPGVDCSTPEGTAAMIRTAFDELQPTDKGQLFFMWTFDSGSRPTHSDSTQPLKRLTNDVGQEEVVKETSDKPTTRWGGAKDNTSKQDVSKKSKGGRGSAFTPRVYDTPKKDLPCRSHFLNALGVTNLKGSVIGACRYEKCGFMHVDLDTLTKKELHDKVRLLEKLRADNTPAVLSDELAKLTHEAIAKRE